MSVHSLKLVVLVKMVPDVPDLKFDPVKKTLVREGVKNYTNPFDRRATEEALKIKEKVGAEVTLLTMGPPQAEETLREGMAMGADRGILLTDRAFAGSDTLATSTALALAVKKVGFDLVLGGRYSVDAETAQLVPEVAQLLSASLATNVTKEEYLGDGLFRVEREYENGVEEMELQTPSVISVSEKLNKPRGITASDRQRAAVMPVTTWTASDLSQDLRIFGMAGSPTVVESVFDASYSRNPVVFNAANGLGNAVQEAFSLAEKLLKEKAREPREPRASHGKTMEAWSVFLEGDSERRTGLEVLSKLRSLGMRSTAIFADADSGSAVEEAVAAGASQIIELARNCIDGWSSAAYSEAISEAIKSESPYAVFFPSTVRGREIAARVAASLRLGLTGDATDLVLNESNALVQVKPAFGGSIMAAIVSKTTPQMATVRPGVFAAETFEADDVPRRTISSQDNRREGIRLLSRRRTLDGSAGELERARVVICGGNGVGSPEDFGRLKEYAGRLGIAICATRKAVDLGWAPTQLQVGLTGMSIQPDVYIGIGVSGATNHTVGIRRSKVLLAINKDAMAPILKACDVGIVADYHEVLPLMEARLKSLVESMKQG